MRLHAVKLLCLCAQLQPDQLHTNGRRCATTRADAAFARLCSMACDAAPAVRVEALARLAALPSVGKAAAAQALSKQLTALTTAGRSLDDMHSNSADRQVHSPPAPNAPLPLAAALNAPSSTHVGCRRWAIWTSRTRRTAMACWMTPQVRGRTCTGWRTSSRRCAWPPSTACASCR